MDAVGEKVFAILCCGSLGFDGERVLDSAVTTLLAFVDLASGWLRGSEGVNITLQMDYSRIGIESQTPNGVICTQPLIGGQTAMNTGNVKGLNIHNDHQETSASVLETNNHHRFLSPDGHQRSIFITPTKFPYRVRHRGVGKTKMSRTIKASHIP